MDTKQLVNDAVTVLVSLLDYRGPLGVLHQGIASHLYLGMGCDIHRFNMAKGLLDSKGWITHTSELVTLTAAGVEKAEEFGKLLDEAGAQ